MAPVAEAPIAAAQLAACRRLMKGGSKSFFAASLLLPARVRADATALYAFCRVADDAIDDGDHPHDACAMLAARLDAVYARRPQAIAADEALAAVVHAKRLPRALLDALLEGFLWDAEGRRYPHIEALHGYGARVAGTVGALMAIVMGTRDATALARACELGVAMQLTNIARDVGDDARHGRLYLPLAWMAEAGLEPAAFLAAPRFDPRVEQVVRRLLAEADRLYRRAEAGIAMLPRDCRPAIRAARLVYDEIGRELARRGADSISRRTVVPTSRKLALLASASSDTMLPVALWPASRRTAAAAGAPPIAAVQFLVEAAAEAPRAVPALPPRPRRPVAAPAPAEGRVAWVLDLLERRAAAQRGFG
jgi:phytoene synthase